MTEKKELWEKELDKHEAKRKFAVCGDCGLDDHCGDRCPNYTSADMIKEARRLLAAEDARQDKLHELLETIREQIRLHVSPEHRPEGLFKNIQDAVYAMRGRTRLMDDAAITSALLSPAQPQGTLLSRLATWTYLYATEGEAWPDHKTVIEPLVELSKHEPTQADADILKAGGSLKGLVALALTRPNRGSAE